MRLIDKKLPSLLVSKKGLITVSYVILSVVRKSCMQGWTQSVNKNGYYGEVQYWFRSGSGWSTSDCVYVAVSN